MNKKLLLGIGATLIIVILSTLLAKYIRYGTDNEKNETQSHSVDLNTNNWVTKDLVYLTIKYPPQENCGHDSEVFFVCVADKENPELHLGLYEYISSEDNPYYTCGKNFEDCVARKKQHREVLAEKRFLIRDRQGVQLEFEGDTGKYRILLVDLGRNKGVLQLFQNNLTAIVSEVYEEIIKSIEFK